MSLLVFAAVLAAALMHAVWNALVKNGDDKSITMAAVVMGQVPLALIAVFWAPIPAIESWRYLFTGVILHLGYQLFLLLSYRSGDFTQVYPIARGTGPLLVAGVSVMFLGVHLQPMELAGVIIIALGIISLSLVRHSDGIKNTKAAGLAFLTGCFIASYSLVDGFGARLSGSVLGYYAWLTIGNVLVLAIFIKFYRPQVMRQIYREAKAVFVIGGSASFIAYSMVIWAFTQAPIPLVTALRETSVVFALLIGVVFLREKLNLAKLASVMITLCGAIMLRLGKVF